ncbi:Flp pilus assembly protein CpaB [Blastococcus sp. URHD0036]|uniref:Flp pilus assembly protein CpaB n=1 Tax=Blastococcus sp. URHD0036 TaxID=1380356 RepID=UPI0004975C10|nr:Flp pilus assembly protein CpaB [Blastococcus sp. URHD0036]
MIRLRRPRSVVHLVRQCLAGLLATAALVLALRPDPVDPSGPDPGVPVVTAAADLPAGTPLERGHLAVTRLPTSPGGAVADPAELVGRTLAGAVRAGEPVTDVRLVGSALTSLLPAGTVAAPVRPADVAVSALPQAGDRVDVLATADGEPSARVVAPGALVLMAAPPSEDPSAGLLLLAVDSSTAADLAAAATTSTLTLSLPPP